MHIYTPSILLSRKAVTIEIQSLNEKPVSNNCTAYFIFDGIILKLDEHEIISILAMTSHVHATKCFFFTKKKYNWLLTVFNFNFPHNKQTSRTCFSVIIAFVNSKITRFLASKVHLEYVLINDNCFVLEINCLRNWNE